MRAILTGKAKPPADFDPGTAPMLQWIAIDRLMVDDSYQRELKAGNWKAIQRIASQFRWSRFSPVFVAPIEGGRFAVIDGQHRTHAAALCGLTEVPCQVVQMSVAEQAASFAAVNGLVTKVTPLQIYKAALAAGETWAKACDAACRKADCRLMTHNKSADDKRPGEVYALGLIRNHVERGASAAVTFTLAGLRSSECGAEPAMWGNDVLKPLLSAMCERPWLVKQKVDLVTFLDSFDIYAVIDRAEAFAREKRRQGHIGISKWDIASVEIGEGLDLAFRQRIAAPTMAGGA